MLFEKLQDMYFLKKIYPFFQLVISFRINDSSIDLLYTKLRLLETIYNILKIYKKKRNHFVIIPSIIC